MEMEKRRGLRSECSDAPKLEVRGTRRNKQRGLQAVKSSD